jgi:membrane protease YdiL (CAAX protease family)
VSLSSVEFSRSTRFASWPGTCRFLDISTMHPNAPPERGILLRFFAALFVGAMVLGPVLYFVTRGHWPFHRVMDRALMISALAALGLAWPRLRFREWWPLRHWAIVQVLLGLLIALLSVQTILAVDFACGGLAWVKLTSHEWTKIILTTLLAALLVPPAEETIFRGFLQTEIVGRLGWRGGWTATALLYALAHFLKIPDTIDQQPVRLWSGVTALGASFQTLGAALHAVVAPANAAGAYPGKLVNLILIGLVLGGTFRRTGNLWLNYGLHGGWIVGLFIGLKMTQPAQVSIWTGTDLVSSPLTTIVLLLLGWWLWRYYRRPQPGANAS